MSKRKPAAAAEDFAGMESIPVEVTVKVGQARCTLARISSLAVGDVVELETKIGDSFELLSNGVLLARVDPVAHGEGVAVKIVEIPEDDDDSGS